ncbi:aspartate-semialdehyde dehydrogenase [Chloroflexota bacterium]
MKKYNVAIVGATGLVGQEFIKILEQRQFPIAQIRMLASHRSEGKIIQFAGNNCEVQETTNHSFKNIDIALFSAGGETSKLFARVAAKAGAIVVDNSSAWRMDKKVPLVVPEVNADDIKKHKGIIANPNCSTIQMVAAINPIHKVNPIKRVVVDTYQAVAGTGKAAIDELTNQSRQVLDGHETMPHVYPHQIAFNVLPEIDVFLDNGYTKEEWKMVEETHKIMHDPNIAISATCVRVPVFIGHSESVHLELTEPMSAEEARRIMNHAPGVQVLDDPGVSLYPHAWSAAGQDDVFVGRVRLDNSHPCGLAMWVVSDNLRKGAALNAVQIAEELVRMELV